MFYINLAIQNPPFVVNSLHRPYGADDKAKADYLKEYLTPNSGGLGSPTFLSFDEVQVTINITNYSAKAPFSSGNLARYRQVGYLHIQDSNVGIGERYYFVTSIKDNGKHTITYNCKLDYGTTYGSKDIINENSYTKVLKTHTSRYIKDDTNKKLWYNFNVDSYLHSIGEIQDNGSLPLTFIEGHFYTPFNPESLEMSFLENENYIKKDNPRSIYLYALYAMPTNQYATEKTFVTSLNSDVLEVGGSQPFLIIPLHHDIKAEQEKRNNLYSDLLDIGNLSDGGGTDDGVIKKVFSSNIPLIPDATGIKYVDKLSEYYADKTKVPVRFKDYLAMPLDVVFRFWGLKLDSKGNLITKPLPTYNFDLKTSVTDNTYLRYIKLNDGRLPIDEGKYIYEPKLYTYPHLKCSLISGKETKEVYGEKLSSDFTETISLSILPIVNGLVSTQIYGVENGFYKKGVDVNTSAFLNSNSGENPITTNAYTSFIQNHRSTFNTSLSSIGQRQDLSTFQNTLGLLGSIIGLILPIASGARVLQPLSTVFSSASLFSHAIGYNQISGESAIQRQNMQSLIPDLQNRPTNIHTIPNDFYGLLTTSKNTSKDMKICFYELPQQKQEEIAMEYHRHGYIVNQSGKIKYADFMSRSRGTFGQINNFMEILKVDNLPNQVVQYFNNLFERGITLGDTKTEMYNYDYMNWEKTLL